MSRRSGRLRRSLTAPDGGAEGAQEVSDKQGRAGRVDVAGRVHGRPERPGGRADGGRRRTPTRMDGRERDRQRGRRRRAPRSGRDRWRRGHRKAHVRSWPGSVGWHAGSCWSSTPTGILTTTTALWMASPGCTAPRRAPHHLIRRCARTAGLDGAGGGGLSPAVAAPHHDVRPVRAPVLCAVPRVEARQLMPARGGCDPTVSHAECQTLGAALPLLAAWLAGACQLGAVG